MKQNEIALTALRKLLAEVAMRSAGEVSLADHDPVFLQLSHTPPFLERPSVPMGNYPPSWPPRQ